MVSIANGESGASVRAKLNGGLADFDGYVVGRYYLPYGAATPASGASSSANFIRMFYGVIKQKVTIDQLAIRVSTAGTNAALAVYRSNAQGRPTGTPVAKTASFPVATNTTFAQAPDAGTVQLDPGAYWFASWFDAATTTIGFSASAAPSAVLGSATLTDILGSTSAAYINVAQTFGAWPDMTAQTMLVATGSTVCSAVAFRVASVP